MKTHHIAAIELVAINSFVEMFPASTRCHSEKLQRLIEAIVKSVDDGLDTSAKDVIEAMYVKYNIL